jgi:hypothetical protein
VAWDQAFFDPIILPRRRPLVTLRDAALNITKLPKARAAPRTKTQFNGVGRLRTYISFTHSAF